MLLPLKPKRDMGQLWPDGSNPNEWIRIEPQAQTKRVRNPISQIDDKQKKETIEWLQNPKSKLTSDFSLKLKY